MKSHDLFSHYSLRISASLLAAATSFASLSSFAAAPELAVDFYRQVTSPFPSGQIHQKNLEKTKLRESFEFSYLVSRNKRQFWLEAKDIVRDVQLSKRVINNKTKETYSVLESHSLWLYLESDKTGQKNWLPMLEFSPTTDDTGLAMNLTSSAIREKPHWKSEVLITLPATSRFEILSVKDSWAHVRFQAGGSLMGYVDINNLLLKVDFASFILNSENKWIPIKYREGDKLIGTQNQQIPLSEIKGMMTRPDLGVVSRINDQMKTLLRQHLTIIKTEAETWNVSNLKGHGEVFWKKKSNTLTNSDTVQGLNNDQILQKEIYSVAFDSKNPNFGIISANGIFMTVDGKSWKQLKQFQNQNHPVLITNNGELLVGSQRSKNQGKNFEPFIKWEILAKIIEEQTKAPPKQLKISSLELNESIVKVQVDTGTKKMVFASRLNAGSNNTWELY